MIARCRRRCCREVKFQRLLSKPNFFFVPIRLFSLALMMILYYRTQHLNVTKLLTRSAISLLYIVVYIYILFNTIFSGVIPARSSGSCTNLMNACIIITLYYDFYHIIRWMGFFTRWTNKLKIFKFFVCIKTLNY